MQMAAFINMWLLCMAQRGHYHKTLDVITGMKKGRYIDLSLHSICGWFYLFGPVAVVCFSNIPFKSVIGRRMYCRPVILLDSLYGVIVSSVWWSAPTKHTQSVLLTGAEMTSQTLWLINHAMRKRGMAGNYKCTHAESSTQEVLFCGAL